MTTLSRRSKGTPLRNNVLNEIYAKQFKPYYLTKGLRWELHNTCTY